MGMHLWRYSGLQCSSTQTWWIICNIRGRNELVAISIALAWKPMKGYELTEWMGIDKVIIHPHFPRHVLVLGPKICIWSRISKLPKKLMIWLLFSPVAVHFVDVYLPHAVILPQCPLLCKPKYDHPSINRKQKRTQHWAMVIAVESMCMG